MRYVLEYIQTDPEGSPTPGSGHYAGERSFDNLPAAKRAAGDAVGHPVPAESFWPCCDWQKPETLVTMWRIVTLDDDGNERGELLPGDAP